MPARIRGRKPKGSFLGRSVVKWAFSIATAAVVAVAGIGLLDRRNQTPTRGPASPALPDSPTGPNEVANRDSYPSAKPASPAALPTGGAVAAETVKTQGVPVAAKAAGPADHNLHKQALAKMAPTAHRRIDPLAELPRDGSGAAKLDWSILAATTISKFPPGYPKSLSDIDGQRATLVGFMAPLTDIGVVREFLLLELPVGCFFCVAPPPNGIVRIEMANERPMEFGNASVKITGILRLNRNSPEDFYFSLTQAELAPVD